MPSTNLHRVPAFSFISQHERLLPVDLPLCRSRPPSVFDDAGSGLQPELRLVVSVELETTVSVILPTVHCKPVRRDGS